MTTSQLIGEEVDGYRIRKVIGKGGMGVVFEAEDVSLGRLVAIKLIDPKFADEEAYLRRFRREAKALARLRSPHIVMVHALRRTRYGLFIIMEFVSGESLAQRFGRRPVAWREVVPVIRQVLLALDHAHGLGVVHRDIKPSNIMVTDEGEVRVMDFGIAKLLENDPSATVTQEVSGSPYYMSPEQVSGERDVDARTDLYSLGMTAYLLLTGRLPFDEDSNLFRIFQTVIETEVPPLRSFNSDIPEAIASVVEKALRKPRGERYQSAKAMRVALDAAVSVLDARIKDEGEVTATIVAQPARGPERAPESIGGASESHAVRYAALVFVCLGVLGGSVWVWNGRENPTQNPPPRVAEVARADGEGSDEPAPDKADETGAGASTAAALAPDTRGEGGREERATEAGRETERSDGETERAVRTGTVVVRSEPAGARVRIDGTAHGRTPARIPLPEGTHRLTLELEGHEAYRETVRAVSDRVIEVAPELVPVLAPLRVVVRPWGNVYIDGVLHRENVSFVQTYELPVGLHTVSVRNPEFGTWEQRVEVAASSGATVEVDFKREIGVSVTAFDPDGRPVRGPIFVDGEAVGKWSPATIPLRMGRHQVEVRAEGYNQEGGARTIDLSSTTDSQVVRLTLWPSSN